MKVNEVTKNPAAPKQRNPIAAYAQRSGAGVHKDQNKKNKPLRKEKHKKKDFTTESRLDESPIRIGMEAVKWILRWMRANPLKSTGIWAGFAIGPEVYRWWQQNKNIIQPLAKYGIPALALAYILKNGIELWKMLKGKDPETISVDELKQILNQPVAEAYKQKAGDYARHGGPMPKKKKRGPHPLGGKLVG